LPPHQREALLASLTAQLEELSTLVGELVVLAKVEPVAAHVPTRLDGVVEAAVERARRRAGDRGLTIAANQPWTLDGDQATLERAVVNLLDNAVKFSPPSSRVTVCQQGGVVQVDDEGPGVRTQDRAAAFGRFWRSDAARGLPGSGLGLAIVADAAAAHGGSARLEESASGGTRALLMLPGQPADDENRPST
jgi:two-component system sensor histidine kinase MprB